MEILIVGTGNVGLETGVYLQEVSLENIICIDLDHKNENHSIGR